MYDALGYETSKILSVPWLNNYNCYQEAGDVNKCYGFYTYIYIYFFSIQYFLK